MHYLCLAFVWLCRPFWKVIRIMHVSSIIFQLFRSCLDFRSRWYWSSMCNMIDLIFTTVKIWDDFEARWTKPYAQCCKYQKHSQSMESCVKTSLKNHHAFVYLHPSVWLTTLPCCWKFLNAKSEKKFKHCVWVKKKVSHQQTSQRFVFFCAHTHIFVLCLCLLTA